MLFGFDDLWFNDWVPPGMLSKMTKLWLQQIASM